MENIFRNVGNFKILKVDIDTENRAFIVEMFSDKFAMYGDLYKVKENMCHSLRCDKIKITCRSGEPLFDILPDPSRLKVLWASILQYLQCERVSLWALLKNSKMSYSSGTIYIISEKATKSALDVMRADSFIDEYIYDTFGEHCRIVFEDKIPDRCVSADADDYECVTVDFSIDEYNRVVSSRKNTEKKDYSGSYDKVYGGSGSKPVRRSEEYKGKGSGKKRRLTPEEGQELPKDSYGREIIMGGQIDEKIVKMQEITADSGYIAVKGRVFKTEFKELSSGSYIAAVCMTDELYSITIKFFFDPEDLDFVKKRFKDGKCFIVYGDATDDRFAREIVIRAKSIVEYKPEVRMDNAEVKRVELHLHTNMSAQDGLTRPKDLVATLDRWGHTAVAITDHGVVQAYPDMFNSVKFGKSGLKLLYGIECYLTDQPGEVTKEEAKNIPRWHCIILVKNLVGLKNLYKLISKSNLNYYYKRPLMPRFEIENLREGLIIGSACSEGELYDAIISGESEERLLEMASFYDYLEIQPIDNNQYLLRQGRVASSWELREINKRIVELGDLLGKMTVATGDVHFLNPEDALYRNVMQTAMGFDDADMQPPLYLKTTEEMLREFEYLGDRAYEVVVENTNKIADMIESIRPVPDGFFPPVIEGSDDKIRQSSYDKVKEIYGDRVPDFVMERLNRELDAIIGNGYSIMYLTAKELVAESARNGYTVGSRGSVGSSLAAFMSGITEVNSLPPHYRCPKCFYNEFFLKQEYESGCELPHKDCPECGTPLVRDGFDIPFETFLGFDGDKVPDIDLNFASDDQPNAHRYTAVLFGEDYVFRAGTISGLAEKNARGYVLKYLEKKGIQASESEINRLASGFTGVRKTTGQHPGGIMVIPKDHDIYDFTPIQHPADKTDSDTITTHFDYHFLHDNILKLDILGHDGPAMLKYLGDFTGVDTTSVDIADEKVLSLFNSATALEMDPRELRINIEFGTLGIPEFGTSFAMGMLKDTLPTTVSELVRIAGLSHGTDVWLGNAQDLIKSGTCTLSQAICCRDDIMLFLIKMGMDKKQSFVIMEQVRKGKGLKPEQVEDMMEHDVPDWYIESCKKIKYMFPKAHAVAYVVLSLRIAWFKVYYPVAYYCTRFTLKVDEFDAENMIHGVDKAFMKMTEMKKQGSALTDKDDRQLIIYEQLMELYARGVEFLPVDLYKSDAVVFRPEDGKIRPPFSALQGVGTNAAQAIVDARNDGKGEFISIADLRARAKLNKAVIETLRAEGCLDGMPEDDNLSLLDLLDGI
ncbi:MAG: PolC-type DNA polymerase III [Ruminococcaceae bacterium]|nr:PolC-type DNA polymerase III [Oscillospiraceae bacterium]